MDDAITTALEVPGNYVRMFFVDNSGAFNTIIPETLVNKMSNSLHAWLHSHPSLKHHHKFADNKTVVGLIHGDKLAYRDEILKLSALCSVNNLSLNTSKTKQVIIDFKRHRAEPTPNQQEHGGEGPHL